MSIDIVYAVIVLAIVLLVAYAQWWQKTQTIELLPLTAMTSTDDNGVNTLTITAMLPVGAKPLAASTVNWTGKNIEIRSVSSTIPIMATIAGATTSLSGPLAGTLANTSPPAPANVTTSTGGNVSCTSIDDCNTYCSANASYCYGQTACNSGYCTQPMSVGSTTCPSTGGCASSLPSCDVGQSSCPTPAQWGCITASDGTSACGMLPPPTTVSTVTNTVYPETYTIVIMPAPPTDVTFGPSDSIRVMLTNLF